MSKKLLCAILSVLMMVSILPMGVFADGSHSVTLLYIDSVATVDYPSAEEGTVVTITAEDGLYINGLAFYLSDYTYLEEFEFTISDDNRTAYFTMPDYDVIIMGVVVKESVRELEYIYFAEYDLTIAQEDLEAYDGEDTEAKLVTWVNSVMNTWDIDPSLTWEVGVLFLSEPLEGDSEKDGVKAGDRTFVMSVTLPDEDYIFSKSGKIIAAESEATAEETVSEAESEAAESVSNPTTGVVLSFIPMAIAALAAVSLKRR